MYVCCGYTFLASVKLHTHGKPRDQISGPLGISLIPPMKTLAEGSFALTLLSQTESEERETEVPIHNYTETEMKPRGSDFLYSRFL